MLILSEVTYRFSAIPIEISVIFFIEIERESKYIYMKPQKSLSRQNNLRGGGDSVTHFQIWRLLQN